LILDYLERRKAGKPTRKGWGRFAARKATES
jgi:hypothetical protein